MPPEPSILRLDFLPDRLAEILAEHRFDGSIVVQATTVSEEVDWLLDLAGQHEFIRGVVGWVDLTDDGLPARLDELQKHPKFRGVRHPVHDEEDSRWLMRADVLRGLKELERRDLPYDLLLRPVHLPLLPELSDRLPRLRMVIDHIAKPPIAEGRLEGWAEDIERAAQNPQVYVKLSGMITEAGANWSAEQLKPFVQHVFDLFGPDRTIFGSDWPVCLMAGSWKQTLAAFTQSLGPLPMEVRAKLLGETAARFYR
jgi:L-fuconolactonase